MLKASFGLGNKNMKPSKKKWCSYRKKKCFLRSKLTNVRRWSSAALGLTALDLNVRRRLISWAILLQFKQQLNQTSIHLSQIFFPPWFPSPFSKPFDWGQLNYVQACIQDFIIFVVVVATTSIAAPKTSCSTSSTATSSLTHDGGRTFIFFFLIKPSIDIGRFFSA